MLLVAGTSEQLTANTEQNSKASREMTEAVQEISEGAATQLSQIQLASGAFREIKDTLELCQSSRLSHVCLADQYGNR
ncbi:hypothetical protein JCM10914_3194 [Paenibacillus sp. JCM 10914]|nr:hypothetical protein JCM10914_3194 [Paenibacillus sp. JCM 10914]